MPAEEMAHEDAIRATGVSLGEALRDPDSWYDVPSAELRFVSRTMPDPQFATAPPRKQRILQQLWAIYHHAPGNPLLHHRRETEWRDVPLVEEG